MLKKFEVSQIGVFVVVNKDKKKDATLDMNMEYYYTGETINEIWVVFPWEITDSGELKNI